MSHLQLRAMVRLRAHLIVTENNLDPKLVDVITDTMMSGMIPQYVPTPPESKLREALQRLPELIARDVAEMPDRSSPDDFPEALVVTSQELMDIVSHRIELTLEALSPQPPESAQQVSGPFCSHCGLLHEACECWDNGELGRDEKYVQQVSGEPSVEGTPLTTKRQVAGIGKSDLERYEDMLEHAIELERSLNAARRVVAAVERYRNEWEGGAGREMHDRHGIGYALREYEALHSPTERKA